MKLQAFFALLASLAIVCCAACANVGTSSKPVAGKLLIVGGGLDNDTAPIYRRFVELARECGPANIVIVSAATGPQEEEITDKTEALRVWAPGVPVSAVRRELRRVFRQAIDSKKGMGAPSPPARRRRGSGRRRGWPGRRWRSG